MFYSYKNCKILINDIPYYVQSASLDEQNTVEPGYNVENRYNVNYAPANGIGGTLNLTYLLTGKDQLIDYISLDEVPVKVNFGGIYFNSGYLKSYSFNLEPTQPLTINSQIVFFDSLSGDFTPTYEEITEKECLNTAEIQVSNFPGSATRNISNITKLSYQYNVDIEPHYSVGDTIPNRVVFGPRHVDCEISSEKTDPYLSVSGNTAYFRIKLNHPTDQNIYQYFDVRGLVNQKSYNTNANSILENTLSIQQDNLGNFNNNSLQNIPKPIIYFFKPGTGYYGTNITISGNNFDYVNYLSFSNDIFTNFSKINNNQIDVILPDRAISGPITLYTSGESVVSSDKFFIGGLPITINSLSATTGYINDKILISGNNFYEVSKVIFGSGQEAEFEQINYNLIEAKVPTNTALGTIKLVSQIFDISGESTNTFVPVPKILGFYPLSGFSGDYITISGYGFNGTTGIRINNLPINSSGVFTVTNNTGISFQIPSGNTKGKVRVYGQFGVSELSTEKFFPYAEITGLSPISGRTGEILRISGRNFIPEILYNFGNARYAVSFQGGVTGYFALTDNNTVLSGAVPWGAKSGKILLHSTDFFEYPSNFSFRVKNEPPILSYITPISGKTGDFISIIGQNLVDINSLTITGTNTGYVFSSAQINTSISENYINIQIPSVLTGGRYSAIVNTIEGYATGSGIHILQRPFISGFNPLSGTFGSTVTLTGLDIYPNLSQIWIDGSGTQANIISGSTNYNNNTIQFYIPNNLSSGHHKLIVYNTAGSGSGAIPFIFVPKPSISGFSPISGSWGETILISGSFFDLVSGITIGNTGTTNFTRISSTGIQFTIPSESTSEYITLSNSVGSALSANKLLILPPLPVFSGFRPTEGYFGTGVMLTGQYLNSVKEVHFSGVTGGYVTVTNLTGVKNTGLYFTVPGDVVTERLRLVNAKGSTYTDIFNIISGARIDLLNSHTGVFKDQLYISGKFLSGSIVFFQDINNNLITGDNISVIGDTGVYFNVPREIVSNSIIVKGRNGVTVSDTGIFYVLPTISGISGVNSYASGGYITITGVNVNTNNIPSYIGISGNNGRYYNIANMNEFSGIYKTGYSIINCRLNSNFAGTGKLFLISEYDTNINFDNFTGSISYTKRNNIVFNNATTISQPAPVITSFSPSGGSPSGVLTISGGHLFSTNNVIFNVNGNYGLGTITSTGHNRITVIPPLMTTGTGLFYITTPFGTTSSGLFRVLLPLIISGYTPTVARTGDNIRISGISMLSVSGVNFGGINATFSKVNELGTTIITGVVPSGYGCCDTDVLICVVNESESYCL